MQHLRLFFLLGFITFSLSVFGQEFQRMIDAGTYTVAEIQQAAKAHFDVVGRGKGTGYKQFKRWEYVALMETDASGIKIQNQELSRRARDYRRAQTIQQADFNNATGDWKELGPTYWNATSSWNPGVGRITSIGIDATNNHHIIVGSPTGGVWKTLDAGNTWTPLTDDFSTVDVYSLEISPYDKNQYLWGSTNGRIYRSTDAGASWNATGNAGNSRVIRIHYHPTDPNVVYAVTESGGLYRSTNSGATWIGVAGVNGVPGYDVEFKPGDPNTIYFSGISVYRSTNGGASFTQIPGFGTANNNYKMMGVSPADPNVVYVLESDGGRFGGLYKSTNSGASYTKIQDGATINYFGYSEVGDDDRGQAPRDMDVAVNLSDAEDVHIAGIHTWRSVDGGQNFFLTSYWTPGTAAALGVGYNHADIDILKFAGDTLFVGSDGGIYHSLDQGQTFIDRTAGLGIREFYKIGVSKTNPNVVSGGSQDNGTSVMRGDNRAWVDWLGADGMETFVDWSNPAILYGTSQYGSMYRSTNQGTSQSGIEKPDPDVDGAWVTPFEQDPLVPTTIYVAFADVWKSTNSGNSWTKISSYDNGNMNHMKLAPSDNQRIYVARGSNLFTTANGGTTWTTLPKPWGSSNVSYIAVHPENPLRLVIVLSGSVYHSTDGGMTWNDISAGLPSTTKYCAAWENTGKNGLYVGSFGAISYTNDDLPGQWVGYFDGLPNARVYELEVNYVSNTIFAGTYGRGLWESPLYRPLPPVAAFEADKQQGCRELTVQFTDKSAGKPVSWLWTFEGGTPATSTLQNPVVTFSGSGAFGVTLSVTNAAGSDTLAKPAMIEMVGPAAPVVAASSRCGEGTVQLTAANTGFPVLWYANETDQTPLVTGDTLTANITQTTTYYVAAVNDYGAVQKVGPVSNAIGAGGDHNGNFYQIFDALQPFKLKSVLVYAVGAKNRTFNLRNNAGTVILQKTVFVPDGASRVTLDMDVPQGTSLQLGCPSPANLFRNSAGVNYPYTVSGVVSITGSTAGPDYYYYTYDWEVETGGVCESIRVPVTATIDVTPSAPVIQTDDTVLCPGETATLSAENICVNCVVTWSNGQTGATITVDSAGSFSAIITQTGNTCGNSSTSNEVSTTTQALPLATTISTTDPTTHCPGEPVLLVADNVCSGCTVLWSNGATGNSISVEGEGDYTVTVSNICGVSDASNTITTTVAEAPEAPVLSAASTTVLCPGQTVTLTADNICPDCTVKWSTGETTPSITVNAAGTYTATLQTTVVGICSESPVSNAIDVTTANVPESPVIDGPTLRCVDGTIILTAQNVCPDCVVLWSNGVTGTSITVSEDGVYSASSSNGCGAGLGSNSVTVSSVAFPDAPVVSNLGSATLCPGDAAVLEATLNCVDCNVIWSNGTEGTTTMVTQAGSYTASIQNVCGISAASNTIEIAALALPEAAVIAADGATTICEGDAVTLAASNVCSNCTLVWSDGSNNPEIVTGTAGMYTATLQNICGNSPASNSIEIVVNTIPAAPVVTPSSSALCPGTSVMLTVENVCPGCTVVWSNGVVGNTLAVTTAGDYSATLKNDCGESSASSIASVSVLPEFSPVIAVTNTCQLAAPQGSNYQWLLNGTPIVGANNQFWTAQVTGIYSLQMTNSDGCDGTATPTLVQACVSGVQQLGNGFTARLFPNPTDEHLFMTIQSPVSMAVKLDLFAADGRFVGTLFQGDIQQGQQTLDTRLPAVASSMYHYRLSTEMGDLTGTVLVDR